MIPLDPKIVHGVAAAVRQHPEVLLWLEAVVSHEVKRLPYAVEHVGVFQGRCQMANELLSYAKGSPDVAARL